jgi:hypothetical protein
MYDFSPSNKEIQSMALGARRDNFPLKSFLCITRINNWTPKSCCFGLPSYEVFFESDSLGFNVMGYLEENKKSGALLDFSSAR